VIHDFETHGQLASIEGSSLRAPKGEMDDLADGFALAQRAREILAAEKDDEDEIPPSTGYYEF
jgi:hypothetical protein